MNEILIRKAKKGDKDAFCRLMDEQMQSMYKIAISYVKNDEDAADAIQDTILSCYENLKSLKYNRYFKTWMIRILINKCKDILQRKNRMICTDEMPEMPFHEAEYASAEWAQMLEPLDEKYRMIVLLYYMEGFNTREISEILDMKHSEISSSTRKKTDCEDVRVQGQGGTCLMMTLNDNEKNFQKKLQKDTEIPVIVRERANQAYHHIENNTAVQKRETNDKNALRWMKTGGKVVAGTAAVLAAGILFCAANPVMAKNIPVVGGLFETLQDKVSFFGDFADHATTLEDTEKSAGAKTADGNSDQTTDHTASDNANADTTYTKTSGGLTITCSEIFANSQAVYVTMQFQSEEPFPDTLKGLDGKPAMEMYSTRLLDFKPVDDGVMLSNLEGEFLDENTYACILRVDLAEATKDYSEYNKKYEEMCQQVRDEMGITLDDINDETEEGSALLGEYIEKISVRGGALQSYIKEIDIPEKFNMHLGISEIRGMRPDEASDPNDPDAGYYKFEGDWSFDIPVTVDDSETEVQEINETNEAGIGLKSVIRTPYELTVNELYEEGSNSDCFMVALDANGNRLPYNESNGNCNNFAIQDRDISTVDIYILDYVQYMDELKGEENYNNNEKKPEGEKWSDLLDQHAKYHKTLHFNQIK